MQATQHESLPKYLALISNSSVMRKDFFFCARFECKTFAASVFLRPDFSSEETPESKGLDGEDGNNSLDDAARAEHEYLRQRLRDELRREPTEEEMNEWLRRHTEGY